LLPAAGISLALRRALPAVAGLSAVKSHPAQMTEYVKGKSSLIKFIILLSAILLSFPCLAEAITITVLYNNVSYDKELTCAWGMSCFIEGTEKSILFDTGGDSGVLLSNMEILGVDPGKIDAVVLSHIHGDHIGGLWGILEKNNKISLYLPHSFPAGFKKKASQITKEAIYVKKEIKICDGVWSTGQLGIWIKEQSLVISTENGLVVVTGCAHPGVVDIVKKAKDMFDEEVYLILGGFHLLGYSESQVREIIRQLKKLGVKKVGPSHCTGGRPIELFREAWGDNFVNFGCGAKIEIP
jgi:7,8-dihydropterin-6-yl-methyl-4-(beta-D-ribofuranosyl)aminobenzene 5'-phosphate synthase